MSSTVSLIVGSATTLAGVVLGFSGSAWLSRRERRDTQRDQLRLAVGAY